MSVIERAEQRLNEEERQHELGADNRYDLHYWAAYLDGARAQKKESDLCCADCVYTNSSWPEESGSHNGPRVLFPMLVWVEHQFVVWCQKNHVEKSGTSLIAFMINHDWINRDKLVADYENKAKEISNAE